MPAIGENITKATAIAFDPWQIEHRFDKSAIEEDGLQAYRMECGPAKILSSRRIQELPEVQITEQDDSAILAVGKDLAAGAIDELTNHPGRVLVSAAIGLGVGIGASFLSPIVIGAGLVAAGGYGLYTLAHEVPAWVDAAKVISNPDDYSAQRKMQAHDTLHDLGAGTVTLVASAIGALGTAPATAAIKSVFPSMARTAGHNAGSTFGAAIFDDVVVPIVATRGKDGV
jgi:hypothetical protein